jgi:hypothetical protein
MPGTIWVLPCTTHYGCWLHKMRPIVFSLIVDDFAVKYVGKENAEHWRNALLRSYERVCFHPPLGLG